MPMKVKILSDTNITGGATPTTVDDAVYVRVSFVNTGFAEVQVRDTQFGAAVQRFVMSPYDNIIIKKDPTQYVYGSTSQLYFCSVVPNP